MNKELLYKYFRSETSPEEDSQVVKWVEASVGNRDSFLHERKLWNISVLQQGSEEWSNVEKTKRFRAKRVIIWQAASVAVMLLLFVSLWFNVSNNSNVSKQTVIVPIGQRVNLILADGTSVWLNSNTRFTYPSDFNSKTREVEIQGEAFFEVAKKNDCPFIVHTSKYQVEVSGTTFNVYAYDGCPFETDLVEGQVKVRAITSSDADIVLNPNEKARESGDLLHKLQSSKTNEYDMRKDGILVFNDEPISNVLEMLGAYYDTKIYMECPEFENYRCTSKFFYKDSVEYILKVIQRDLHYKIEKNIANNTIILR